MKQTGTVAFLSVAILSALLIAPRAHAQRPTAATSVDWPLHNLDLAGSRYSEMDQINRSNVASLTPRWLFQHGVIDGVSNQTTPVVVDGVMYVTDSRGSVYALNASDGHLLWSYDVTKLIGGRGCASGSDCYIFRNRSLRERRSTAAGSFLLRSTRRAASGSDLGNNGQAAASSDVLGTEPDPCRHEMGYWFTIAPQV